MPSVKRLPRRSTPNLRAKPPTSCARIKKSFYPSSPSSGHGERAQKKRASPESRHRYIRGKGAKSPGRFCESPMNVCLVNAPTAAEFGSGIEIDSDVVRQITLE